MKTLANIKIICTILLLLFVTNCNSNTTTSEDTKMNLIKYGENYKPELEKANQEYLFGMDYLSYEWYTRGVDYEKGYKLLSNMGVKSIRNWMHFGYFMRDPNTFIEENVRVMHDMLHVAASYNFQIIGMNHVNWSVTKKYFSIGKEKYQTFEGSKYEEWLDVYE